MKKTKVNYNYKEAGITLVALVVTIIVLLILAGVTISLALNNNGVIGRAQYASNTWANATLDEERTMGQFASDVDTLTEGYINREGGAGGSGGGSGNQTGGLTGVDFGEKTVQTITQGDTLVIGGDKFMVLRNSDNEILAIGYRNLIWNDEDIKQIERCW